MILKNLKLFALIGIAFCFCSCSEEDSQQQFQENSERISTSISTGNLDKILKEMREIGNKTGKMVTFQLKYLNEKDYRKYFKLTRTSKKKLAFIKGKDINHRLFSNELYTITCYYGQEEVILYEGENVGEAGKAARECLNDGGCVTTCLSNMSFAPISQ
ncbi:hypothetical protein [Aureivirga marina]|uniref:hypothetical protein n=1 Tax=Aureivirga marina TaxID=1182451 RepID=UPI0018C97FEC|nr:hypothetical protein [Aureivirga marina]